MGLKTNKNLFISLYLGFSLTLMAVCFIGHGIYNMKMLFICRTFWWSYGETPGEVSGSDGELESPEGWFCLSPSLWSVLAEVLHPFFPTVWAYLFCGGLFFWSTLNMFRYKPLCPETWPNWNGKLSDGVSALVNHLGYKAEEYKLGR